MEDLVDHLERQPDGSWKLVKSIGMQSGPGMCLGIPAGRIFAPGETFMGIDLVAELEAISLMAQ